MTTNKMILGIVIIMTLLLPLAAANVATANPAFNMPYITIKSDGTIDPQTDLVNRDGNVYYLTSNLTGNAVQILCSNIVFSGSGYYIVGGHENTYDIPGNAGLQLESVVNVTVKNVQVIAFTEGIALEGCVNCSILRVYTDSFIMRNSNFNTIAESDFGYRNNLLILFRNSNNNVIYSNNITTTYSNSVDIVGANFWDNGTVGNYWSLYSGVDSNYDGVGDTPYAVNALNNVDYYPLMQPIEIQEAQPNPLPSDELQIEPKQEIPVSYNSIIVISSISIVIITTSAAGFLFYRRNKRHHL